MSAQKAKFTKHIFEYTKIDICQIANVREKPGRIIGKPRKTKMFSQSYNAKKLLIGDINKI